MDEIRRVAVIGAGTMGAAIAAHVANAGVPVVLLDIVAAGAMRRSSIAESAVEALLKSEPAAFMSPRAARLVTTGNIEDDATLLADCDWIIEAVIEKKEVKQSLYRWIDGVRKAGSVVSSNTSTIPLAALIEGLPAGFAADFCVTHFFNPPRYMRLLEVVAGTTTSPATIAAVSHFADLRLGKTVISCADRPGFIANRLGVFWLHCAVVEALDSGLDVEEVDAIIGRPMGIPKTGVFGLLDLVGIDLMPHVVGSLIGHLPPEDHFHRIHRDLPLVTAMIAAGNTGRKGKGGFYRLDRTGGGKVKQAISLRSGTYRPQITVDLEVLVETRGNLPALLAGSDRHSRYAWRVLSQTLAYAASLVPESAADIVAVDAAMRLGYNWTWGPFELIDQLGVASLTERLGREGMPIPPLLGIAGGRSFYRVVDGQRQFLGVDGDYHDLVRPPGVLLLEDIKLSGRPLLRNRSAALWDIGDGVACFEFTTKMNALDPDTLHLLEQAIALVGESHKALVLYNEGRQFSAGANLGLALFAANIAAWSTIERMVAAGQQTYRALKYAPFPVVGAPAGLALGGGCEVLLHCDAVQAHAESYIGLVECGVGLIPAWGGCTAMLHRWATLGRLPHGPMPAVARLFEVVSMATVSKSAADARDLLYLRPNDGVTMNRDRLLADAKARALALVANYAPPAAPDFVLPGETGRLALTMAADSAYRRGVATAHDRVVAATLAEVLSGDGTDITATVGEAALLDLERRGFMELIRHPRTLARIEATLETGKPLRN